MRRLYALMCALAMLAGCRSNRLDDRIPFKNSEKKMKLTLVDSSRVKGWSDDNFAEALASFKKSCIKINEAGDFVASSQIVISADFMRDACMGIPSDSSLARGYFETWFDTYEVATVDGVRDGLVTGYYEAEVEGSVRADANNTVPIYGKPADLVADEKYRTRKQIEDEGLKGKAPVLFYAKKPSEVHILQIQGSGRVKTKDGLYRIGYAGNNGYSFKGIGSILKANNVDVGGGYSMVNVKKWLDKHPAEARKYMQQNERYIFFREVVGEGPIGALGVPLTPMRSIAVDNDYIPLGLPMFLNTYDPDGVAVDKLVVAQDIGTAIKGAIRVDLFYGYGAKAFDKAGRMSASGRYYILLPKDGKNFAVKK